MENRSDKAFFEQLCEKYYTRIFRYCMVRLNDVSAAEDLTQDVFAVAWQNRRKLRRHENPPGFLYLTAQNLSLAYLRRKKKMPLPLSDSYDAASPEGDAFDALAREADAEIDETLYVKPVLAALSPEEYGLYKAYYLDHRLLREIAKERKISEAALRMRLTRLRRKVKKTVSEKHLELW